MTRPLFLNGKIGMPKRSRDEVEADINKIVKIFQSDARISFNDLAEKTGFSRQKIWRIIKSLENNKTIWGYTTIIDHSKLGLKQYVIMLKRKSRALIGKKLDKLVDRSIKKQIEKLGVFIETSYYTNGDYDWIAIASAESIIQMKKYAEFIIRNSDDILSDVKIVEILFPLEINNIENPKKEGLLDFFV
jgi:DNA-binding Lrp family transcriptional regulator